MKFKNAAEAFNWFAQHPKLIYDEIWDPWFEIIPVLVNPETKEIDDDSSKNTLVNWWIEAGPYAEHEIPFEEYSPPIPFHDYRLDCGADTADEAMIKLSELVLKHYGDY